MFKEFNKSSLKVTELKDISVIKNTRHIWLTVGGAATGSVVTFNNELVEAARNGRSYQEEKY